MDGLVALRSALRYTWAAMRSTQALAVYTPAPVASKPRWQELLVTLLVCLMLGGWLQALPSPSQAVPAPLVWGRQPVLAYLVLTPSIGRALAADQVLSPAELDAVRRAAYREQERLQRLEALSLPIVGDPTLSLEEKRLWIARMGYNQAVQEIVRLSQQEVQAVLTPVSYLRFVTWLERTWAAEVLRRSRPALAANPRSYSIYATRYDSKGAYTVALPDKCLKFANAGSHICDSDGYSVGQGYAVFISYKKGVGVTVGESGPWNVDDNYWSRLSDPQPRRMFADLGLGIPEAQAAYFNGYNGGKDQFGRKVTGPYGIDLARQVSIDIGLEPGVNDWITVSFMWTAAWDGQSAPPAGGTPGAATGSQNLIQPVEVATPRPDGSVVHIVQFGQALWSIAVAYNTTIQDIRTLNDLGDQSVIIPGQELLIFPAGSQPTATPTFAPSATATAINTQTPTLPVVAVSPETATLAPPATGEQLLTAPTEPRAAARPSADDLMLALIGGLTLAGLGLLILGKRLERGG